MRFLASYFDGKQCLWLNQIGIMQIGEYNQVRVWRNGMNEIHWESWAWQKVLTNHFGIAQATEANIFIQIFVEK